MERLRILVVGAGLAGLALARSLRHAGFDPEVIDRAGAWEPIGTGIYLPANGVRALAALGLEEAVAARAAEITHQRVRTPGGRVLVEVDLRRSWGAVGPCLAVHRADLHAVLRDGVEVRMGRGIEALERVGGPVRVTFDDGRRDDYDLVVGADGLRSTVRRLVVDQRPPRPVGQHSWRFVTACPPEVTCWSVLLDRRASFLTIPIGQGLVYGYADVLTGAGNDPGGDPVRQLRERFAGYAAPVPWLLERLPGPEEIHVAPIEEVATQRWGRGAVVLIGDAAHAMSPNMAQGASLAFEDALVLAGALREAATVAGALAALAARRAPRTGWARDRTHRRDRTRALPPMLRDPVLRAFGRRIFAADYRPLRRPYERPSAAAGRTVR
jgi:2-polyprenyl-6-methoxyphenol hydroxylase-like FAD-dependent oxidoreductase